MRGAAASRRAIIRERNVVDGEDAFDAARRRRRRRDGRRERAIERDGHAAAVGRRVPRDGRAGGDGEDETRVVDASAGFSRDVLVDARPFAGDEQRRDARDVYSAARTVGDVGGYRRAVRDVYHARGGVHTSAVAATFGGRGTRVRGRGRGRFRAGTSRGSVPRDDGARAEARGGGVRGERRRLGHEHGTSVRGDVLHERALGRDECGWVFDGIDVWSNRDGAAPRRAFEVAPFADESTGGVPRERRAFADVRDASPAEAQSTPEGVTRVLLHAHVRERHLAAVAENAAAAVGGGVITRDDAADDDERRRANHARARARRRDVRGQIGARQFRDGPFHEVHPPA